ncbi:MAG: methyltransferase domain-containing protein [archaeon]
MKNAITGRSNWIQSIINLVPKSARLILNPNRRTIELFVEESAKKVKQGSKVLDAGAGPCPYNHFFKHCNYEATDFFDPYKILDFTCTIEKIPRKDNSYDTILSTEVLEHVEDPQKVIGEFYRVLKKKGKLFLTAPQGWKIHQEPYNYFYFTRYGLELMLKKAGFKKFKITPKGGYFWLLSDTIRFNGILEQYKKSILYYPLKIIEYPITNIIFPLILFPLDFIDREKKWTMGYLIEAEK